MGWGVFYVVRLECRHSNEYEAYYLASDSEGQPHEEQSRPYNWRSCAGCIEALRGYIAYNSEDW